MNGDFEFSEKKLTSLFDFANEITDTLNGLVPYFMVFAIKNIHGKTEYKMFSHQPTECGLILNNDKFKRIYQLFGVYPIGLQSERKDWKIPSPLKKELTQLVYDMNYYCIQNKIPCFMEFLLSNKHTGDEKADSEYLMEIVSPFRLMLNLYDDKITKIMRYTFDPNVYPSEKIEISESEEDFKDIEVLYNDKGIPKSIEDSDIKNNDIVDQDIIDTIENYSEDENTESNDSSETSIGSVSEFIDYISNEDFTDALSENTDDQPDSQSTEISEDILEANSDIIKVTERTEIKTKSKRGRKPKGYYKNTTIDTVNDIWQDDFPAD